MQDTTAKKDIVVTRVFDAPVELVWKAWTDPQHVMRWWGPIGFTSPTCEMDVRVGGTSLVCMRSPEGQDLYLTWAYREIDPMRRIEFIQNLADKDGKRIDPVEVGMPPEFPKDVRTVVALEAMGASTKMIVTEYGYTADRMFDLSLAGLNQCLDKMGAVVASTG